MFLKKRPILIAVVAFSMLFIYRVLCPFSLDVAVASNFRRLLIQKRKEQLLGYNNNDVDLSSINGHDICSRYSLYRNIKNMTSPIQSTLRLIQRERDDAVHVAITAVNGFNVTKTTGGDLFVLWAEQVEGDGCTSGHVVDHNNGTYSGYIKLFWTGRSIIKAKLASTVENFCIRRQAITKYGDVAFAMKNPHGIKATFKIHMREVEETRCANQYPLFGYKHVCNFTKLNDDSPWYCGAPVSKRLNCSIVYDFKHLFSPNFKDVLSPIERNKTVDDIEHRELKSTITVITKSPANTNTIPCHKLPKEMTWTNNTHSSGFFLNKTWNTLNCKNTITFHPHSYQTCLKNKTLVFLGDSTTRQYCSYLTDVLKLPKIDLKIFATREFKNFGVHIIDKTHEMPLYSPSTSATGIKSEATEINNLAKSDIPGKDIVIVAHYCAHLHAFSSALFRFKIKRLADSIKNLLEVKPDANVFIKGPHVFFLNGKWFDVMISLNQKNIIFDEFKDLRSKVIYLDTWSITAAHNSDDLHPNKLTLTSLIQQFMSYLCSK